MSSESTSVVEGINSSLATVIDPELHRPITELGMVESVENNGRDVAAFVVPHLCICS